MIATYEQIEDEAHRRFDEGCRGFPLAYYIVEVTREGWTPPPPPIDPDLLAFREWASKEWPLASEAALRGHMDTTPYAKAYLAGARMARKQEQERAEVLAEYVDQRARSSSSAEAALAAYRAGRAAR
jgi:hypothetical protein